MSNLKAMALFAGAGGLSTGFKMAGYEVLVASDVWEAVKLTYEYNHPDTTFILKDIHELSGKEMLDVAGLKPGDIDILIGGPPCQGFSLANQQSRFLDNPNNRLFKEFIRIVEEIKPKWFLMENVVGLLKMSKGLIKQEIIRLLEERDYIVNDKVLKATDYGVPQIRERIFFVGNNQGISFNYPETTHKVLSAIEAHTSKFKRYVTVAEAISDLPSLNGGFGMDEMDYDLTKVVKKGTYASLMREGSEKLYNHRATKNNDDVIERYKYIKQGENWSSIPRDLMLKWRNISPEEIAMVSHSSLYKRLDPELPSITVANFRKSMFIHPWEDRGLTVREGARLQSFPDKYRFLGNLGSQQQQIANAVPPLLAKIVAEQIKNCIEGKQSTERNKQAFA